MGGRGFHKTVACLFVVGLLLLASGTPGACAAEYNFDGRTMTIGYDHHLGDRHFSEPQDRAWLEEVEAMFNVNIEFCDRVAYGVDRFMEYLSPQILAGDTDSDIRLIQDMYVAPAAAEGLLMTLDDFLDEGYWSGQPEVVSPERFRHLDGSFYHVRGVFDNIGYYSPERAAGDVIHWNKSLFEREGLPSPHDLYRAGEWTWEAFRDIAFRATRDTTGDGVVDQIGFASAEPVLVWTTTEFFKAAFISNEARPVRNIDGRMTFTMDEPEAIEVLEFWQEMVYEPDDEVVMPRGGAIGLFRNQRLAMQQGRQWNLGEYTEMDDDYSMVPYPMGPRSAQHYAVSTHTWGWGMPVVVRENPRALIEVVNALYRLDEKYLKPGDTWEDVRNIGREQVSLIARDREALETHDFVTENLMAPDGFSHVWVPDFQQVMEQILIEGMSPSAAVDAIKPATQQHLDDVFN